MAAQPIAVETAQIALRSASANQHDRIEVVQRVGHGLQSPDDRLLGLGSLHEGVEQRHFETIRAGRQFLHEVLVPGRVARRDDGQTLHDGRHRQLAVHVEHSVPLQLLDRLPALALHIAERIGRIDVRDLKRQAVKLMVGDERLDEHLQSRAKRLAPGGSAEIGSDHPVRAAPDHRADLRLRDMIGPPFLDQFQIAVPRIVDFQLADLGRHPIRQRMGVVDASLDKRLKLAEGYMLQHGWLSFVSQLLTRKTFWTPLIRISE